MTVPLVDGRTLVRGLLEVLSVVGGVEKALDLNSSGPVFRRAGPVSCQATVDSWLLVVLDPLPTAETEWPAHSVRKSAWRERRGRVRGCSADVTRVTDLKVTFHSSVVKGFFQIGWGCGGTL